MGKGRMDEVGVLTLVIWCIGSLKLRQRPRSWVSSLLHHIDFLVPRRLILIRRSRISFWTVSLSVVMSTQLLGDVGAEDGPGDGPSVAFSAPSLLGTSVAAAEAVASR